LSRALAQAQIHGLRTNRELLVRTLAHAEFLAGKTDTDFLVRHDPAALAAPLADEQAEQLHAVAAALAASAQRRREAKVLASAPSGWRNNPSQFQRACFRGEHAEITVEYNFQRDGLRVSVDGRELAGVRFQVVSAERIDIEIAGVRRAYEVHRRDRTLYVDSPLGASVLEEISRFPARREEAAPGSLVAPLPGVVNEVRVKKGDAVSAGDVVLVIDSMKVFHWISAPLSGRVAEVRVEAGHHVEGGAVLAVIEESS
jgi:acetyl/propionyl-CoA carboxylase alpha subunit